MPIYQGNEPDTAVIGNTPVGLYYYFIDNKNIGINKPTYLGYAPTIESVTYNPFLEESDISLMESNFDVDKFGKPDNTTPKCYRIITDNRITKILGSIKLFPTKEELYNNYPLKLYCYPYRYFIVTDYINPPLLIKPELVETNNNSLLVKVTTSPLTQQGKYNLWVEGYKNDFYGTLEGMINNISFMLPVSSSAYSQFLATSSAEYNQSISNALLENNMSLKHGMSSANLSYEQNMIGALVGGIGSLASLNGKGVADSLMQGIYGQANYNLNTSQLKESSQFNEFNITSMRNAKTTDMLNTPRTLKTSGNDTLFNMANSNSKIEIIEYQSSFYQRERLKNYFIRYGYSVNDYTTLNVNSRKHFNFVKTTICNITGSRIPTKHLNEIKDIFNKGITIWHMDNGTEMFDYYQNNEEV